jgi:integrase
VTDQSVLSILDRIRRKAKVRPFSPHDLRRSLEATPGFRASSATSSSTSTEK